MKFRLAAALVIAFPYAALAQVSLLQIQTVEGEGTVHAPGTRSQRPLVVAITDETGRPVAAAAVSFRLPDSGPGGAFANGLRTEVVNTDDHGRATLRGLRVNRVPGRFQIRIVASKEQAHAGAVSFQYVAEPASGVARASARRVRKTWIAIIAAGAAAAAGVAATRSGGESPGSGAASLSAPAGPPVQIGVPVITVGKP